MHTKRRLARTQWFGLVSFVLPAVLLALFGFTPTSKAASKEDLIEGARKEGEVVVYASMNIEEVNSIIPKFEEKYPFLKVRLNRVGSEKLLTKVLTEMSAKKYFADVIQTLGFSMHTFMKKGILGNYVSSEDRFFPKEFKEEGYWTTVYYNPYVVAYNTKMVPTESHPKNYEDLLDPVWKGKMMMEGTKVDWFGGMLQIMGREKGIKYMRDLSKQNIMHRTGHSLIAQLVAAGEAQLDINIPAPTVDRMKKTGAPIDWMALGSLPASMVGIGIASRPPHPYAARLYVDFVLSKEGQKLLSDFGRYLARSEFAQKQIAKPKAIHVIPVNPALGEKMDEYAKQLREIFSR